MQIRIGVRLIIGAGLVTALAIAVMASVITRIHTAQLEFELTAAANQLSETIKSSTHDDMLGNRREELHGQIRNISSLKGEGIQKVRIFNKEGRIMFSSDKEEIGTALDKRGEACYVCHAEGKPLEKLDILKKSRIFNGPEGFRVLGIINPIPNDPSCATAACHAHSPGQSVLGVLDVQVSMAQADREIQDSRRIMLGLATLAILASSLILWWLTRRLVLAPVAALVAGTRRLAEGDLSTTIQVASKDEMGDLAQAFNAMTTRLAETQRQLTQADKLASVGRLAAGIAHEINNPLTGVLTYASLLEKRFKDDDENRQDLEVIIRETKRCRGIIRELLDFARHTAPARRPTDLNEVVRHSLAVVMNQLSVSHVDLALDLMTGLPEAPADGNQIQQVVVNLLLNAADAIGPQGGQIKLHSGTGRMPGADGEELDCIELWVEDSGTGISPEDLPRLFEPFFSTKGNRGTGLGLAVTWGIVEAHGGIIDVQSELGHWTRFTLRLPLAPPPPSSPTNL
jgi:two-component system NtrC family sensor kinase